MNKSTIFLDEKIYIGQGRHKKTFYYPLKSSFCIKISYGDGDKDMQRELKYRALREQKHLLSTVLPNYHGIVHTNLGKGYVFDLLQDYHGGKCKTLEDYVCNEKMFIENFDYLLNLTLEFKQALFKEQIITMGIFPENLIIKKYLRHVLKLC